MQAPQKRKKWIAGNWKMNILPCETAQLVGAVAAETKRYSNPQILLCVPYTNLHEAVQAAAGTPLYIGAQNCHWAEQGAYTGEISPQMLRALGVGYVLLGHSERRALFGETDETVKSRLKAALAAGLVVVLCIGETHAQRMCGTTNPVLEIALKNALLGVEPPEMERVLLAYEPVWAIGTGNTATEAEAESACAHIRHCIGELYGTLTAQMLPILYGGSMNDKNAAALLAMPNIDGGLIGSAALDAQKFAAIVKAADECGR